MSSLLDDDATTTWAQWAGPLEKAAVSADGRLALQWALAVVRDFFGDDWLVRTAATGRVPMMTLSWWPLTQRPAVVRLLELAARLALLPPEQRARLQRRHARSSIAPDQFVHLCLLLEVAALGRRAGWDVEVEAAAATGRRPDIRLSRGGVAWTVEVTGLGLDRVMRATEAWSDLVERQLLAFDMRFRVQFVCRAPEVLDQQATTAWLGEVEEAARATRADGAERIVRRGGNEVVVFPAGRRPAGPVFEGPLVEGDLWQRVQTRLRTKAVQTSGGDPTWLRVDEQGALCVNLQRGRWSC